MVIGTLIPATTPSTAPTAILQNNFPENKTEYRFHPSYHQKADDGRDFSLAEHFNLYYILLEDLQNCPMSPEAHDRIKENIENFYEIIKPPWDPDPPNTIRDG